MKEVKSILVFGGGLNQLTLIQAAKELGHVVIVIDPIPDAPGGVLADFFYKVAPDDYSLTKEIAVKHNIDGLVTSQMQNPLRIMARLAEDLKIPFMSQEDTENCIDKHKMKSVFINNSIPCAKGVLFNGNCLSDLNELDNFSYPLIIKPVDSHSSRGVYKVNSLDELKFHIDESRKFSSKDSFLVEEFIMGREFSIEAITYNHETTIIQYTEKYITEYPNAVELGHLQPANLSEEEMSKIESVVKSAVRALKINNSGSHTELKLTKEGPVIIEIGARLGGDFISSYLTTASTGINMDKLAVQLALSQKPEIPQKQEAFSFIKYLELPSNKKVLAIEDCSELKNDENLIFYHFYIKTGDVIPEIKHSALRPACFIIKDKNKNKLLEKVHYYENIFKNKIILN